MIISFRPVFRREGQAYLGTVKQGEEDYQKLHGMIRGSSRDETILFDITGFDLFGYSYAKQTIRRVLQEAIAGLWDQRCFLVHARGQEEAEELSSALAHAGLAMLASAARRPPQFYDEFFFVGELSEVYKATMEYIVKKKEVTSGELQKALNLESVQAASNRISRLAKLRLVRWEESANRSRNVLQCKRIEV